MLSCSTPGERNRYRGRWPNKYRVFVGGDAGSDPTSAHDHPRGAFFARLAEPPPGQSRDSLRVVGGADPGQSLRAFALQVQDSSDFRNNLRGQSNGNFHNATFISQTDALPKQPDYIAWQPKEVKPRQIAGFFLEEDEAVNLSAESVPAGVGGIDVGWGGRVVRRWRCPGYRSRRWCRCCRCRWHARRCAPYTAKTDGGCRFAGARSCGGQCAERSGFVSQLPPRSTLCPGCRSGRISDSRAGGLLGVIIGLIPIRDPFCTFPAML